MCPTTSASLPIAGAPAGSSLGSQFWVTRTGAWSAAEYALSFTLTSTFDFCVPSVRPAYDWKLSRTWIVGGVAPPHWLGERFQVGSLGEPLGSAVATAAAPA